MEYVENALEYEDYCRLRESVGWLDFSETQTKKALCSSLYTVIATENNQTIGMGRLVGDGMYDTVVDLVVHPLRQNRGIGSKIMSMIVDYVARETPAGGRSSVQPIAEKGKEAFYEKMGFKTIPHEFCGEDEGDGRRNGGFSRSGAAVCGLYAGGNKRKNIAERNHKAGRIKKGLHNMSRWIKIWIVEI